jgi:hypothetical protein
MRSSQMNIDCPLSSVLIGRTRTLVLVRYRLAPWSRYPLQRYFGRQRQWSSRRAAQARQSVRTLAWIRQLPTGIVIDTLV